VIIFYFQLKNGKTRICYKSPNPASIKDWMLAFVINRATNIFTHNQRKSQKIAFICEYLRRIAVEPLDIATRQSLRRYHSATAPLRPWRFDLNRMRSAQCSPLASELHGRPYQLRRKLPP